jgi:hypothetical protein
LARKIIVASSSAWGADGIGKETAGETLVENVHGIAVGTTYSYATHQHSSPAAQSALPSTQHISLDSHITPSFNDNNSEQNKLRTNHTAACEYGQSLVRQ